MPLFFLYLVYYEMWLRKTASYWPRTLDAANEDTLMLPCGDFRNAIWTVTAETSFSGTLKFYTSNMEWTRPDIDSAASATNQYSTTQVVNLWSGATIAGDTGFVATWSSDGVYQFEVNTNANYWAGAILTARAAGAVTLSLDLFDNQ